MQTFSRRAASLGLLLAVATYFALGSTLTLECVDEGQILYPSWLVSLGAVPYRDFPHLYGPMLFALNGALFRVFGTNLLVIRLSLVCLKTLTVALSYSLARRVVSRAWALLVCAVLVAVWGTPVDTFNVPYGNHYSLTLTLSGLLVFLSLPRRFRLGCLLAGLAFGCAATFKSTAGAFGLAGFVLFLLLAGNELPHQDMPAGASIPAWCIAAARLALLGTMAALLLLYLERRNTVWNAGVIFLPALCALGMAVVRELREPVRAGARVGLWGVVYAGTGAAIPLGAAAVYFAGKGALSALAFDQLYGLPQMTTVFEPIPFPGLRIVGLLTGWAVIFAAVGIPRARRALVRYRSAIVVGLLALVVLSVATPALRAPLAAYVHARGWYWDVLALWWAVPLLVVWLAGLLLWRAGPRVAAVDADRALLLVYCNAVTSMLLFYPVADVVHVVMDLPAFVPLAACLLERFSRYADISHDPSPVARRVVSTGLIGALAACLTAPSLDLLGTRLAERTNGDIGLRRATGIRGAPPRFGQVAAVVAYIDATVPAGQTLLALNCQQLLYVLAARRSALDRYEFLFYLAGTDQLPDAEIARLVDQRHIIATLEAERPVVIEGNEPSIGNRLRGRFDDVSRYVDAHYRVAADVAGYRILIWAN